MDFIIKSRYGQVVLNKPVFLAYRIPMARHPTVIVHTFKLEYLWSQLANLDQILCVASLGWGEGCIRSWGRLDQNSGFHGNRNPHWLILGKIMSLPFLGCFYLIGISSPERSLRRAILLPPALALGLALASTNVKVFRTSLFPNPLMDLVYIWYDDRYWSNILFRTSPTSMHVLKVKVTDLELLC